MINKSTPKPGNRVPKDIEKAIISNFYSKYRRVSNNQAPNIPTWCTFISSIQIDEDILSHEKLSKYNNLFVFFEYQDEVYSANIQEIRRFFTNRKPWEDYDIYVFPESIDWCIAFTHEQAYGIYIFLTGDTKKFFN